MESQQRRHQLQTKHKYQLKIEDVISHVHCPRNDPIAWLDPESSGTTQSIAAIPMIVMLPSMNPPAQN